jgi:hypothetical protein
MTETTMRRPPILTGACLYLGTLSAIMAVRAITLVSTWNADNRAAEAAGTLQALRDAGLSAGGAESAFKTFVTVVAVLAACGVVFAVYTARGHRPSRVGLTVVLGIAGLTTFLGVLGGSFLLVMIGALAVVFTIRLWTGEIRTYFRVLAGHAPPVLPAQPAPTPHHPSEQHANASAPPSARIERMPTSVSIAVWTTFTGSLIVAIGSAIGLISIGLAGNDYEQLVRDSPFSQRMMDQSSMDYDQLYRLTLTLLGICLPLALAGLAASILVLVTQHSGDVFLFVMAVVTVVISALMVPVGLPWTAAAIVCLVQLRKPTSKAWFAASR